LHVPVWKAWRDAHPDHPNDVLDPFSSDIVVPSAVGSGDGRPPGGGFDQPLEENPR
jgi:hypothetical protein